LGRRSRRLPPAAWSVAAFGGVFGRSVTQPCDPLPSRRRQCDERSLAGVADRPVSPARILYPTNTISRRGRSILRTNPGASHEVSCPSAFQSRRAVRCYQHPDDPASTFTGRTDVVYCRSQPHALAVFRFASTMRSGWRSPFTIDGFCEFPAGSCTAGFFGPMFRYPFRFSSRDLARAPARATLLGFDPSQS